MPETSVYQYGQWTTKSLDEYADDAIQRMESQPEPLKAAALLLLRWSEQNSEVSDLLPDLIAAYLAARVKARARRPAKK